MSILRRNRCVFLLLALLLPAAKAGAQTPGIVASIKPLQLIAIAVTGDAAAVESLLDARFSPHDYQFRPSDREKLERADIVFWIGPGFETFLRGPLATLPARVKVVALQPPGMPLTEDGHIWMDPVQAMDIARRMADALGEAAPSQRARWRDNAERLIRALTREDEDLRRELAAAAPLRQYLVTHDTYHYFELRYGLRHAAALADNAEQPSGVRNLLHVQQLLADGTVSCVFREPQYQPKILQTLLREHPRLKVVTVDPMASDIAPAPDGIEQFYRELGRSVIRCLGR